MTLRYTQIADATVHREYFEAMDRVVGRYALNQPEMASIAEDPLSLLSDVIRGRGSP